MSSLLAELDPTQIHNYLVWRLVVSFYPSKYSEEEKRKETCLKQTEDVFGPVSKLVNFYCWYLATNIVILCHGSHSMFWLLSKFKLILCFQFNSLFSILIFRFHFHNHLFFYSIPKLSFIVFFFQCSLISLNNTCLSWFMKCCILYGSVTFYIITLAIHTFAISNTCH